MNPPFPSIGAFFERPVVLASALLFVLFVAALNAAPFLHDPIWQDEAVTLGSHASRGLLDPFLHYISPNNHMAFSSMLAGWMGLFPEGVDVVTLRLLPFLLFLAAVPVLCLAALRLGGAATAIVTGLMFASSTVAGSFATQLRGYGPSWFFLTLMLLAALHSMSGHWRLAWRAAYVLGCLLAIALLPTNFFFALVIAVATAAYLALTPENRGPSPRGGLAFLLGTPVACLLLSYGAVWRELMEFSRMGFSPWTDWELIRNWLQGSLGNVIWITPLIVAGLAVGLRGLASDRGATSAPGSKEFVLAALLVLGFLAAILVIPNTPFPRTLVPFLPIWICAIAYLMIHGVRYIVQTRGTRAFGLGLGAGLVALLALAMGQNGISCKLPEQRSRAYAYDLCYQYFRDLYYPGRVLDAWASLGRADVPIVANHEGFYAVRILGSRAQVFRFDHYDPSARPAPLLVAHDHAEMSGMADSLGLDATAYRLLADTGYFEVYLPTAGN